MVELSPSDLIKVSAWYKDIAYVSKKRNPKKTKKELDEKFEERLKQFLMGENGLPGEYEHGQNQRILGRYFLMAGNNDCLKLDYFLKVYIQTTASERADDASWVVRAGILITLTAPTFGFLSETWIAGGQWFGQMSFYFCLVWAVATGVWFIGSSSIIRGLMRAMSWPTRSKSTS